MNRVLKVVFSRAKGMFVVVSELGRACTKGSLKSVLVVAPMALVAMGAMAATPEEDIEEIKQRLAALETGVVNGIAFGSAFTDSTKPKVSGTNNVAIGVLTEAGGGAVAVGYNAKAKGASSIALGSSAGVDDAALASVAIGARSGVAAESSVALGLNAHVLENAKSSVAVGELSWIHEDAEYSVALGSDANAYVKNSVALGSSTHAKAQNSVALGALSVADQPNVVSVGYYYPADEDDPEDSLYRRIVNVAAGKANNDAVTVSQTQGALQAILYGGTDTSTGVNVSHTEGVFTVALQGTGLGGTGQATVHDAIDYNRTNIATNTTNITNLTGVVDDHTSQINTINTTLDGKANLALDNLTDAGKQVITGLVEVEGDDYVTVTKTVDTTSKAETFAVIVTANGTIASGDTGLVTGGVVYDEVRPMGTNYHYIANQKTSANLEALDTALFNALNSATGVNKSAWWGALGGNISSVGADTNGNNGNGFVTGQQMYTELRTNDGSAFTGTYIDSGKSTGQNLSALDAQVKSNTDAITALSGTTQTFNTKANADASNVGKNATTDNSDKWAEALGWGKIVDDSTTNVDESKLLVTGETVNTAIANKLDNNLSNLSSDGTGKITSIAQGAIEVVGSEYATVTKTNVNGKDSYTVKVKVDGQVADGNTGIVTGDAVYDAIHRVSSNVDNNTTTIQQNTQKIADNESAIQGNASDIAKLQVGKANTALDNLTEGGKTVIRNLAKDSVKVINGSNTSVITGVDGNATTYQVNVNPNMSLESTTYTVGTSTTRIDGSGFYLGGTSTSDAASYLTHDALKVGSVSIDGSSGKISGVGRGEVSADSTDAVNGAQLYETQQMIGQQSQGLSAINRQVGELSDKVKRTGATAAALAGLRPQDFSEGNPISGAVSLGHYEGKQALAVGMFMRPTENFMVGLGASTSGSRDVMMNLGVSYRFGGSSSYGGMTKSDLAQKVVAMSQHNDALDAQLQSANIRADASAKRLNQVTKQLKATQSELKVAQKKVEVADQKLDMVMKELAALREEIQKMKQK